MSKAGLTARGALCLGALCLGVALLALGAGCNTGVISWTSGSSPAAYSDAGDPLAADAGVDGAKGNDASAAAPAPTSTLGDVTIVSPVQEIQEESTPPES